jgi:hypothetical protein
MIRDYKSEDLPELKAIHAASGLNYEFPDLESKAFIAKKISVNDAGEVEIGAFAKLTVEIIGVCRPGDWATPGMKLLILRDLHNQIADELKKFGIEKDVVIEEAHSWIAPQLRNFFRHLKKHFAWVLAEGPEKWTGIVRKI